MLVCTTNNDTLAQTPDLYNPDCLCSESSSLEVLLSRTKLAPETAVIITHYTPNIRCQITR